MAQQALTTQAATSGRLALGLGPSHQVVVETLLGLSYERPARHVREYVEVVRALVETGRVVHEGRVYRVKGQLQVPGAKPFPILVAGLRERMRRLAGSVADGTITWMTGKRTLRDVVVPAVRAAAREAGRPEPRIVASLPVALSDRPAEAREAIAAAHAIYPSLPSYRAMLELEGARSAGDIALVGSESEIERELEELAAAGVSDLSAGVVGTGADPRAGARRTFELLAELARRAP
jgi:F420-dependent oxidoreductase-like protein